MTDNRENILKWRDWDAFIVYRRWDTLKTSKERVWISGFG